MQTLHCNQCYKELPASAKFCGSCGLKVSLQKETNQRKSIQIVSAFYGVYLLFALFSFMLYEDDFSLATTLAIETVFILITIGFSFFDFKNILALYRFQFGNPRLFVFAFLFPVISAFLVYYPVGWLNELLFDMDDNVFYEYITFPNTLFWICIFYVIIPPIFEELAFRGFLFNQMLLFSNWKITILATSFLFALVHFSFWPCFRVFEV